MDRTLLVRKKEILEVSTIHDVLALVRLVVLNDVVIPMKKRRIFYYENSDAQYFMQARRWFFLRRSYNKARRTSMRELEKNAKGRGYFSTMGEGKLTGSFFPVIGGDVFARFLNL